jgi:hypothetical protein
MEMGRVLGVPGHSGKLPVMAYSLPDTADSDY